jgi:hypothetical protein
MSRPSSIFAPPKYSLQTTAWFEKCIVSAISIYLRVFYILQVGFYLSLSLSLSLSLTHSLSLSLSFHPTYPESVLRINNAQRAVENVARRARNFDTGWSKIRQYKSKYQRSQETLMFFIRSLNILANENKNFYINYALTDQHLLKNALFQQNICEGVL